MLEKHEWPDIANLFLGGESVQC